MPVKGAALTSPRAKGQHGQKGSTAKVQHGQSYQPYNLGLLRRLLLLTLRAYRLLQLVGEGGGVRARTLGPATGTGVLEMHIPKGPEGVGERA